MNKYQAAAEVLQRQAVKYQSLVDAAEALKDIGSMEQIAEESKVAAQKAQEAAKQARGELSKAQAELDALRVKAASEQAAFIDRMNVETAQIKRDAEETAAETIKQAQDQASLMLAQAASEKAKLSSELGGLQKAIEAAKEELVKLYADKDAAEKDLGEKQTKFDKLQAKIRELMA